MKEYIHRKIESVLEQALKMFPVILITGPRQAGKSTLLQQTLKDYTYISFDDILLRDLASSDPHLFLKTYEPPIIIDEIQYVPSLMSYIKMRVDQNRSEYGQYILTGSQSFPLMKGVSESLAGRIMILELFPLSWREIGREKIYDEKLLCKQILQGFYPEFRKHLELKPKFWHSSYLSSCVEKDMKCMRNIQDLGQFQRFLVLLAARCGQLINFSEISKECGISQTTAKDWFTLLRASYIVTFLEPYANNLTKRVVKSPKIYFVDTGLLCYLLRIETIEQLVHSTFIGSIFENMIIIDKMKQFAEKGEKAPCYFYRTAKGIEIDLLINSGRLLEAYEIKFTSFPKKEMVKALLDFSKNHSVKKTSLLNLRKEKFPFTSTVMAEHWSNCLF